MTNITVRKGSRPGWALDRVFDDFFSMPSWIDSNKTFMPAVDIVENDDNIRMVFQVPGMDKKDIKIKIEGDRINVFGKREHKVDEEKDSYIHREISYGEFTRSFTLPDSVNTDKIDAKYENGILTILLNKKEEVKPKEIEVKVS